MPSGSRVHPEDWFFCSAYLGSMFHRRAEVPSRLAPLKPTANCFRGSEREANLSRKCCWKKINQQVSAPDPWEKPRSQTAFERCRTSSQAQNSWNSWCWCLKESPDLSRFIPSEATYRSLVPKCSRALIQSLVATVAGCHCPFRDSRSNWTQAAAAADGHVNVS